jgi:hypothetical protein
MLLPGRILKKKAARQQAQDGVDERIGHQGLILSDSVPQGLECVLFGVVQCRP